MQAGWASVLCASGTYSQLLDYVVFAALMFYLLTAIGLFALRRRRPDADRPVVVPGYPWLPAAYAILTAALCLDLLIEKPQYSWLGLGIVAARAAGVCDCGAGGAPATSVRQKCKQIGNFLPEFGQESCHLTSIALNASPCTTSTNCPPTSPRTTRLDLTEARRAVLELLDLLSAETPEAFVVRRHRELKGRRRAEERSDLPADRGARWRQRPFAAPRVHANARSAG